MVELRIIGGGGKPWRPYTDDGAWHAQFVASGQRMQKTFDRMMATFDRIDALLQAIIDQLDPPKGRPVPTEHDAHIKALMQQLADQRREAFRREMRRQIQRSEAELPTDVPLHKRGFGVMDDPDG